MSRSLYHGRHCFGSRHSSVRQQRFSFVLVGVLGVPVAVPGGHRDGGPSCPETGPGRVFDDMVSQQELRLGDGLRAFSWSRVRPRRRRSVLQGLCCAVHGVLVSRRYEQELGSSHVVLLVSVGMP